MQPDSVAGFSDLGQVDGQLRQTHNALAAFHEVLEIDPLNREARHRRRVQPGLEPEREFLGNIYNQNGRQGETNDTRFRFGGLVNFPIGQEDEVIGVGGSSIYYLLPGYRPLTGEIATLNASKRLDDHLLLYAQTNVEAYDSRVGTRPTYEMGVVGCPLAQEGGTTVTLNTFLNNVIENGESVQQDIYRYGANIGVESQLSRFWQVGGNYRYAYYSDVNAMSEITATPTCWRCCRPTS